MAAWLQSNLASWLAVAIALVLVVLAWRVLRPISYVEFHHDWKIQVKDGIVTVTGKVSSVSPAAYISGVASITSNKNTIPLRFKSANAHMTQQNAQVLVFEGENIGGILSEGSAGLLNLKVRLSDGKTKRFKTHFELAPDKEDSQTE